MKPLLTAIRGACVRACVSEWVSVCGRTLHICTSLESSRQAKCTRRLNLARHILQVWQERVQVVSAYCRPHLSEFSRVNAYYGHACAVSLVKADVYSTRSGQDWYCQLINDERSRMGRVISFKSDPGQECGEDNGRFTIQNRNVQSIQRPYFGRVWEPWLLIDSRNLIFACILLLMKIRLVAVFFHIKDLNESYNNCTSSNKFLWIKKWTLLIVEE